MKKNLCIWVHSTVYIDKYIFFFWSGQIWRPITATFFFPVGPGTGFLYLVNLYFLYQYSSRLETGMLSMKFYVHGELCLESTETKYCQIDLLGVFVVMRFWLIQTESWERWLISVPIALVNGKLLWKLIFCELLLPFVRESVHLGSEPVASSSGRAWCFLSVVGFQEMRERD